MKTLKAEPRETLKKSANNKLREQGRIPGIIYGENIDNTPVHIDEVDFFQLIRNEGPNAVFELDYDGNKSTVMFAEIQNHPIKNSIIHIDFNEIDMKQERVVEVPVETLGESEGEKEGGFLQLQYQSIEVKCLPAKIPETLQIDVSELGINESLTASDIKTEEGVELLVEPEDVIVSVTPPAQEEDTDPAEVDENAEPELVAADDDQEEKEED